MTNFSFPHDYFAIVSAKTSKELEPFVNVAKFYPQTNEDNVCIIALCMNVNLSTNQMLLLSKKYGKYIKQNPMFMLKAIECPDDKFNQIKDTHELDKYEEFIRSTGSRVVINYSNDNDGIDLVDDSDDVVLLKTIIYIENIIAGDRKAYNSGKSLQKINPREFDKVKHKWANSAVVEHYLKNNIKIPINTEDFDYVYPGSVVDVFNKYYEEIINHSISSSIEFANRAIRLILACNYGMNEKYIYAKNIVVKMLAYSFYLEEDLKGVFEGRLEKIIESVNSL